ncbi:MAG TPA: CDP-alcohol phosphatidyltransferase family protein [Armatimonadota bacterium]|jgi:phosphatidylglycerophosphate synthase
MQKNASDLELRQLLNPANVLTVSRLVLLPPLIVALTRREGVAAAVLMLVVWGTDLVDGWLARRLGTAGPQGQTIDTLVDFTVIFGLFVAAYASGLIPAYQFLIICGLKLVTFLLQLSTLAARHFRVIATHLSKLAGALAYAYAMLLVAILLTGPLPPMQLAQTVIFVLLALAIAANATECAFGVCARPRP